MEYFEALQFLAASRTRVRVLRLVAGEERVERDAIRDRLDVSRTTVQRNLDALVDRGWLRTDHADYAITVAGRLVAESLDLVDDRLRAAERVTPLVEHAPAEAFDFDLTALADAEILRGESGNPYNMINRHVGRLAEATTVRLAVPLAGLHALQTVHRRILAGEMGLEMVVTPDVAETFREDEEFREHVEDLHGRDGFAVHVTAGPLPFYLGLIDDLVQIGVDDEGEPKAIVDSTHEEVRDWAERTYEGLKADAEPFELG